MQSVETSKLELLDRAKKHYFSLGVGDGAASLCQENFYYGLAKIQYAQEELGLTPNATFISTPDETISHNRIRWASGYGYGGKLSWGDGFDPIIFADAKPNACGMLIGGLPELPKPTEIIQNINQMFEREYELDGIPLEWDFKKGNHFIDIFETDDQDVLDHGYPPYMFIIHCSCPELRDDRYKGLGMYYDKSPNLRDMLKFVETPFGKSYYLQESNAKEYMNLNHYAKDFSARRRLLAAKLLFGEFQPISNPMHQGMLSFNEIILGAQHLSENPKMLFPFALRSDLPAYLIKGIPNLTKEQIQNLGFETRAKKLNVYSALRHFNAVPHGGGYELPHISKVIEVRELDMERYFICEQENHEGVLLLTDTTELEFQYRGKKILHQTENIGLCQVEARMYPRFVLKI